MKNNTGSREANIFIKQYGKQIIIILFALALGLTLYLLAKRFLGKPFF